MNLLMTFNYYLSKSLNHMLDVQVVHTVFEGRLHSQVRCLECKNVSSTFEPFWDLSLEFPERYHNCSSNTW